MPNSVSKESARALLSEIIDYAGLFPPAAVSMPEAVANYASYKKSVHNWMLGRFVVPVSRLDEFTTSVSEFFSKGEEKWKLTVLAMDNIDETVSRIKDFNRENAPNAVCDALEVKADTNSFIQQIAESVPPDLTAYFEIPLNDDLANLVSTLAIYKQRAKIRTGGVVREAFPAAEEITRFMQTCLAANVPFKATAGLHHPLRCTKSLTYESNAPTGKMHGFLNVFLAAAFLKQGLKASLANELLEDKRAENFQFDETGFRWRQKYFLSNFELKLLREKNIVSFGSCSFEEPIEDLREIGIL